MNQKHGFVGPTEGIEVPLPKGGLLPAPGVSEFIQPLLASMVKGKRRTSSTYAGKRAKGEKQET